MYQKACMEERMLPCESSDTHDDSENNRSVALYRERLEHIKSQCAERAADIHEQSRLIFNLKAQIESSSRVLKELNENNESD